MFEPPTLSEIIVSFVDDTPRRAIAIQRLAEKHLGRSIDNSVVRVALKRAVANGAIVKDGNTYREPDDALSEARFVMPVLAEADHA